LLESNDIADIHFYYGGPVFVPFYIGRMLGPDFNIHIYQYSRDHKEYIKVGVSAG
jgi:hypothetical protein